MHSCAVTFVPQTVHCKTDMCSRKRVILLIITPIPFPCHTINNETLGEGCLVREYYAVRCVQSQSDALYLPRPMRRPEEVHDLED